MSNIAIEPLTPERAEYLIKTYRLKLRKSPDGGIMLAVGRSKRARQCGAIWELMHRAGEIMRYMQARSSKA